MRLAFIDDDGNIVELHEATRRDAYLVRGLLFDAIFTSPLEDSMDCFMIERDLREAMIKFDKPQEFRVRNFLVSRNIDQYSKQTTRGQLVSLAFEHGGPLAALALFYATFDLSRNERANITLTGLSDRLRDLSKAELLKRSATFECSEHVDAWLSHIFSRFEIDTRELASILWCLGKINIPNEVFSRARLPSKSWGTEGELVESLPDLPRVITDESLCTRALDQLQRFGFAIVTESSVSLEPQIAEKLRKTLETTEWKFVAVKLLSHVYPKHSETDPISYRPLCELFLPQVRLVCPYFNDSSIAPCFEQAPCLLLQFVEALLSSSAIQGEYWNNLILILASNLLSVLGTLSNEGIVPALQARAQALQARVRIRQAWVSYTYTGKEPHIDISLPFNNWTNAFYAQLHLLKARISIKYNLILSARTALEAFNPCLYGSPSTLERIQHDWLDLYSARISMLEGRFQVAFDRLSSITAHRSVQVIVRLTECLCELGRGGEADSLLQSRLATLAEKNSHTYHRLRLALAHTRLFPYIKATTLRERNALSSQHPRLIFQQLDHVTQPPTIYGKLRKLSILGGLAITTHLDGEVDRAIGHWRTYLEYSKKFLAPGFTDMIAFYSMAELELRLGNVIEGQFLRMKAETLLRSTGRQYHFPTLGTIWLDRLGRWHHEHSQRGTNIE
ncbi:hypothetical protein F5X96DRAFT_664422 [Biscogniauxia mediterranea]|nr:hypothetical protein F5X96DRAFT_664422 [Biscogniauxia mediterranea]